MTEPTEAMKAMRTCATCCWRSEHPHINPDRGAAEFGEVMFACKRRSPVATGGMHCPTMTIWPTVARTDWCGDYMTRTGNHYGKDESHAQG